MHDPKGPLWESFWTTSVARQVSLSRSSFVNFIFDAHCLHACHGHLTVTRRAHARPALVLIVARFARTPPAVVLPTVHAPTRTRAHRRVHFALALAFTPPSPPRHHPRNSDAAATTT